MSRKTRRTFLRQTGAIAAGMMLPWARPNVARAGGDKMHFGLVTYLWGRDWMVPTIIANCTRAKVLGVELRTMHAHGVEPDISQAKRIEVRKRFEDSPVTLIGMGTNQNYDSPDPQALKQSIEGTKAFIRLSRDVGGSGVKVKPNSFHPGVPHEKTIEQIGRSLNEVGRFGAELGQQIRLEVHGQCSPLPIIRQIMDVADNRNVGVCWNSNDEDLTGGGLEVNFNLVKDRFGQTCHVREFNVGKYPYPQLIKLFKSIDYDGWILMEARTEPPDRVAALIEQREIFEKLTG